MTRERGFDESTDIHGLIKAITISSSICRHTDTLLTRKDITNIERTYGLKGAQRHRDDATSVRIWVEEMKSTDDNQVIIYKAQGEPQSDSCNNLANEDFILL